MLDQAREAWIENSALLGNPSSLHASGRAARRIVEESRESIAADLGVRPSAVIFTSGGTEADNLAIKGLFWKRRALIDGVPIIIASPIEHHAVLDPLQWLAEHEGAEISWLPVDSVGRVSAAAVESALARAEGRAALITVMWANNEIGTVQPVHEIAALARAAGVPFHTDAVQALGALPLDLAGIDAVTITGHKIGGPFGVGALIAETHLGLVPVQHGGGQEREVRSGTLDAPGIAAFAVAVHHAVSEQRVTAERLRALREELVRGVRSSVPAAVLNGDPSDRLPGNAHFSFPGCEGDALLMLLDAAGVDVSTGSACSAGIPEPSHVLLAMGVDEPTARGSLRFSLGRTSREADVEALLTALPGAVERASRAGSAARR
ncbi:MAG: cysteine desulfurase [Actinomycetota bacterium]|jgi:cysteine desulfurase